MLKLNGEENQDLISCSSDGTIKAWDLKGVKEMQKFKGHKSEVYCIESFKNNRLLSGSNDTTIKVWNIKTGECKAFVKINDFENKFSNYYSLYKGIRTLSGHKDAVMCLKLLSDNQLISGSADQSIKL